MATEVVRAILVAAAPVAAIVGANVEPVRLDQAVVPPAVVLTRISLVPVNPIKGAPTLDENRVQVDCYAATYAQCRQLADACLAALEAADAVMLSESDNFEPDVTEYRTTQDFLVWT